MKLNNMKTGKRLGLGFGAVTVLLLFLSGIAWIEMTAINTNMDKALGEASKMDTLRQVTTSIDQIYLEIYGLLSAKDLVAKQAHAAEIDKLRTTYKEQLEELKAAAKTQQGKELLAKLEEAIGATRDLNQRVVDMGLKSDGISTAALELFGAEGSTNMTEKIDPAVNALIEWRTKKMTEVDEEAEAGFARGRWILGVGALVSLILAGFFGVTITRSIVGPVRESVDFTGLLAQGDFSKEVAEELRSRKDEMGDLARAFHGMVSNTRTLLQGMTTGVQTVASSAT